MNTPMSDNQFDIAISQLDRAVGKEDITLSDQTTTALREEIVKELPWA